MVELGMATYSKEELDRNRKSVAKVTLAAMVGVLFGFVGSGFSLATLFGGTVAVAVFVALLWWLFASKRASNLDDTWLDGWNGRGKEIERFVPNMPAKSEKQRSGQDTAG